VADFEAVFADGGELKELRGARSVGRPSAVAAGEDEDVSLGVDRNTSDLAEMNVGRKLQKIGDGEVTEFRRLLRERRRGYKKTQNKN